MGAWRLTWESRGSFLVPEPVTGPPPLMLPGAALGSLAARFRRTAHDLGASQLVSAGRGSTSGSGRYPSAFRGPPLDAARRSTWEPGGSLGSLAARCSGRYPSAFRGPLMLPGAGLGSLAARFCWHFRLWTVPERVSGPPLDAARRSTWEPRGSFRGSTSGSGRYPSAFRGPPVDTRSLTVPFAHGARAGASLDRHTVDAHTFAHGARARFTLDTDLGASRLVSAGRGSTSGSGRCPSAFRGPPP